MSQSAIVQSLPKCSLCTLAGRPDVTARFDARLPLRGVWGYLCHTHAVTEMISLGTGKGQALVRSWENPQVWINQIQPSFSLVPESQKFLTFACCDHCNSDTCDNLDDHTEPCKGGCSVKETHFV